MKEDEGSVRQDEGLLKLAPRQKMDTRGLRLPPQRG